MITRGSHNGRYVLENREPRPEPDLITWAKWFEVPQNRIVAQTVVCCQEVSKVFIGIDHRFFDEGPPVLFETMVFGKGPHEGEQRRYSTWDEAVTGHEAVVEHLRRAHELTQGKEGSHAVA